MKKKGFQNLVSLSTEIHTYDAILALLHWDQETYMPPGAIGPRSRQISLLSSLIHQKQTSPTYKRALEKLVSLSTGEPKGPSWTKEEKVCLREWHKEFLRNNKLPTSFVEEFSQVTAEASQVWANAKATNNFSLFAPFLEKILSLSRKKARLLGFEDHPYDPLVEMYEPCMTTAKLSTLFAALKKDLLSLLKKIQKKGPIDDRLLRKPVSEKIQMALGQKILSLLPMNPKESRLDISSHPFSTAMHPQDSRITTRILPNNFLSNIFSILHETGHSLYEMGLSTQHWGTPLSQAVSLSIHESQSRFWETLVGRSLPFWKCAYPLVQELLPQRFGDISLKSFYHSLHTISPGYTRVEADEVHYCLHVILRFEIEKELLEETLEVKDLPHAWNQKMEELFGIVPKTDQEGCLQDIHWSLGSFGYFPTYALGNLFAAQFFTKYKKDHPSWETDWAKGNLAPTRDWLKENIHKWGKTYNAEQLVRKVTGHSLSHKPYIAYLQDKYAP